MNLPKDKSQWPKMQKEYLDSFNAFTAKHWQGAITPLSVVITGSLFLENALNDLLSTLLAKPENVLKMRVAQKLDVLESLDRLPKSSIDRLRKLNNIRNKFAHNLDYSVTYNDIKDLNIRVIDKERWQEDHILALKAAFAYTAGMTHGQIQALKNKKDSE